MSNADYIKTCIQYNLPISTNQIGASGEALVVAMLTAYPFFNVYFLDGKAPVEDVLAEVADEKTPYPFYIQVKSTTQGVNASGALNVKLEKDKRDKLIQRPIPTFLVGVDVNNRDVYWHSVSNRKQDFSTLSTRYVVNIADDDGIAKVMSKIKHDVISFWKKTNIVRKKRKFNSKIR